MNENNIPVTCEASAITSVSQPSQSNDIIDLTEINDCDIFDVNSIHSDVASNNSEHSEQQGSKSARNRRRKSPNFSEESPSAKVSADDSICILYENIQPHPEVVVVNEVIIDSQETNDSANDSFTIPIPPLVLGSLIEDIEPVSYPDSVFSQILPRCPDISSERINSSSQPIDYSLYNQERTPQQPTTTLRHSCVFANTIESPSVPSSAADPGLLSLQRQPLNRMPAVLNLKTVPSNCQSHSSELEKPNIVTKVPKIQCGICLDGPDELAASERNFVSTNCGHVFCNACIKTSMKNAAKCPTCRKKITSRSIHNLYL